MRRAIFSFVLVGALFTAIATGVSDVGASTTNSSAQLVYSTSSESLQNLGTVNLAGVAPTTPTAVASGFSSGSNHPLPVDSENRPTTNSTKTVVVTPASRTSINSSATASLPGFDGITGNEQAAANGGGDLEPPDQGTCAGPDASGNPVVVEIINNALTVSTPSGTSLLNVTPTYALFNQPSTAFLSDPRCAYDATTQRWFFTEFVVGTASATPKKDFVPSTQFVAVSETSDPLGNYQVFGIDTTDLSNPVGDCPCFGDYDMIGFDANGLYITTNEFSTGSTAPYFNGTVMYAISKQSLAAAADGSKFPSVTRYAITGDAFGLSGGSQPYHVSPASTPAGARYAPNTEYFVESNSSAYSDNHLIVYALTNTNSLATRGTPLLQATDITSEAYSFPPNATQKQGPLPLGNQIGTDLGAPFFNTKTPQGLQTDFNAVQEVTYTAGTLYGELDTAAGSGNKATSAAAWFEITPSTNSSGVSAQIAGQGYVATSQNILYPDIVVGPTGNGYMVFALSGPTEFPSAAFTTFASSGPTGSVNIEAAGSGPEDGFTCYITGYGGCRWGDYSGGAVWNGTAYLMTEYIPPNSGATQRDFFTNWGTFVWSGPAT
ncbi:MAG TPA: hypothetical protein VMU68_05890 [Acidimicrobiales bacterium]|nr:hypothetical protein [Acidimicrobiales bacterium]